MIFGIAIVFSILFTVLVVLHYRWSQKQVVKKVMSELRDELHRLNGDDRNYFSRTFELSWKLRKLQKNQEEKPTSMDCRHQLLPYEHIERNSR